MPAVVFDFDGVIADSEEAHFEAFARVFERRGWLLSRADYFESYLGFGDEDLLRHYVADRGLAMTEDAARSILDAKARTFAAHMTSRVRLIPGAAACVRRLAAAYPLAIASGALRGEIETVLDAADLASCFLAIVAIEDVAHGKPSPEPYLRAVAALAVPPSEALAIEDAPGGVTSARAAGLRVIALEGSRPAHELGDADRCVASLDEVTVDEVRRLLAGARTPDGV